MPAVVVKLLAIVSKGEEEYLKVFLEKHGFNIENEYYQKINEYIDNFLDLLITKQNNLKREEVTSTVYSFIAVAIENTFHKYGVTLNKPMSWTVRKIRRHQPEATDVLINNIQNAFKELDEMYKNMQDSMTSQLPTAYRSGGLEKP